MTPCLAAKGNGDEKQLWKPSCFLIIFGSRSRIAVSNRSNPSWNARITGMIWLPLEENETKQKYKHAQYNEQKIKTIIVLTLCFAAIGTGDEKIAMDA